MEPETGKEWSRGERKRKASRLFRRFCSSKEQCDLPKNA